MHRFVTNLAQRLSRTGIAALLVAAITLLITPSALALITGGEGNKPLNDPGWPKGAAAIFNARSRIAWWEGPPFGGGQWHSECRGDARALSEILTGFSRLAVNNKRVILHDGVGASFWLNMNSEPAKVAAARMDWVLMVWQPKNWEHLHKLPAGLNPTNPDDAGKGPPAQIDVFTGGNIRWTDVTVPKGLEIIDQRLEAHGFSTADGIVLEGKILDSQTRRPLTGKVSLELIEPKKEGGYRHSAKTTAAADAQGRWVLKHASSGWFRIVVAADGFVPKIAAYERFGEEPRWQDYQCVLSPPAPVSGRVIDDSGQPLEGVSVQFQNVAAKDGARYESTASYSFKTDAQGRFNADTLPLGTATIWVHKSGYCRPGLGLPVKIPATDVALTMSKSARIIITVEFTGAGRSGDYIVEMLPEGERSSDPGAATRASMPPIRSCSATCPRAVTSSVAAPIPRAPTRQANPLSSTSKAARQAGSHSRRIKHTPRRSVRKSARRQMDRPATFPPPPTNRTPPYAGPPETSRGPARRTASTPPPLRQ